MNLDDFLRLPLIDEALGLLETLRASETEISLALIELKIRSLVIKKYGRNPLDYDTARLSHATERFTGAEIEQAFIEALHLAFDEDAEPGELTVGTALTEIVPLHSLMSEKIEKLRHWAQGRTRHASDRDRPPNGGRKLDL